MPLSLIVASPPIDTNVGIDDELTIKSCPPVPVAVEVNAPVPEPRSTPFELNVVAPVPPKGTLMVVPLQDPVVIFPEFMTSPLMVFVEDGAVIALVDLIEPVTSSVY